LGALGLRVSLTEIDFRVPTPATAQNLEAQKNAYQTLLGICLAEPNCKSFYVWGLNDGSSWIPNRYPGYGAPLLFDDSYKAKPAYDGLIAALKPTAIRTVRGAGFQLKRQEKWNSVFDVRGKRITKLDSNPILIH
jgi:GH35 family endo-1,4-beta-xylanase